MVGRSGRWRESVDSAPGSAWCDELAVSPDDLKMHDGVRPESHPALADIWNALPPRAQDFLRRTMVNAQGYYERAQVLARLVERLQEQVVELERQRQEANV